MSGRILGKIIALCGVGLRSVIKGAGKLVSTDTSPTALAKYRPAAQYRAGVERGVLAETAPIVCAVLIAMALGVASGLWISTGLASPSLDSPPTSAQPGAHTTEQTAAPIRDQPDDSNVPSQGAVDADSYEPPSAGAKSARPDEATAPAARLTPPAASTPNVRDESASAKTDGRASGTEAKLMGRQGPGNVVPCTLSASVSALTIRGGGGSATITLRLNGAYGPARINAATPNWSDIVVFAASQTSGNGVSVQWYTIRSVSKRAGIYRVSFTTPCGTKTIPVIVTQP